MVLEAIDKAIAAAVAIFGEDLKVISGDDFNNVTNSLLDTSPTPTTFSTLLTDVKQALKQINILKLSMV